jgi:hypothetical protein
VIRRSGRIRSTDNGGFRSNGHGASKPMVRSRLTQNRHQCNCSAAHRTPFRPIILCGAAITITGPLADWPTAVLVMLADDHPIPSVSVSCRAPLRLADRRHTPSRRNEPRRDCSSRIRKNTRRAKARTTLALLLRSNQDPGGVEAQVRCLGHCAIAASHVGMMPA